MIGRGPPACPEPPEETGGAVPRFSEVGLAAIPFPWAASVAPFVCPTLHPRSSRVRWTMPGEAASASRITLAS